MITADDGYEGYGSDRNGMIWGYHFLPNQPARPITKNSLAELLPRLNSLSKDEFLWLHFSLANVASETWLRKNLQLPDSFFETLLYENRSTRLEHDDDNLVAVLNDVLFTSTFATATVETTNLCISAGLLISARLRPLRSVDHVREAVRQGKVFNSSGELLAFLLQTQAAVLVDILRQTTVRIDQIEDRLLSNRISSSRSELSSRRRDLVRMQRLLAPEPAAFFRLLNRPPDWITKEANQELRESAEEFSAAINDTMGLIERIKLIQEELVAQLNEQANRSLFLLTVVTVLALPINLVAALFGMNVGGVPIVDEHYGFVWVVSILLMLTGGLAFWALGRKRN